MGPGVPPVPRMGLKGASSTAGHGFKDVLFYSICFSVALGGQEPVLIPWMQEGVSCHVGAGTNFGSSPRTASALNC